MNCTTTTPRRSACSRSVWQLGLWFHRTFGDAAYKSGPFIPPAAPADESEELRSELERLALALAAYEATYGETVQRLAAVEGELRCGTGTNRPSGNRWPWKPKRPRSP